MTDSASAGRLVVFCSGKLSLASQVFSFADYLKLCMQRNRLQLYIHLVTIYTIQAESATISVKNEQLTIITYQQCLFLYSGHLL